MTVHSQQHACQTGVHLRTLSQYYVPGLLLQPFNSFTVVIYSESQHRDVTSIHFVTLSRKHLTRSMHAIICQTTTRTSLHPYSLILQSRVDQSRLTNTQEHTQGFAGRVADRYLSSDGPAKAKFICAPYWWGRGLLGQQKKPPPDPPLITLR
jgi:hypothetical protein